MARYIVKRLLAMIPVLIGVSLLIFFLLYIAPRRPCDDRTGRFRDAGADSGVENGAGTGGSVFCTIREIHVGDPDEI